MKYLLVTVIVAFGLLLATGQSNAPASPQQPQTSFLLQPTKVKLPTEEYVNKVLYPATVLLYQQLPDGTMRFSCTATAIVHQQDKYVFATASHCIVKNQSPYISPDEAGAEKTFIRVKGAVCGDTKMGMDVCLLSATSKVQLPVVEIGSDPKGFGGIPIVSVASPAGIGKQVFEGSISSTHIDRPMSSSSGVNWSQAMVLQLPGTMGGSSGSAVVCTDQQAICGITVGVIATPMGQVTIAMPISRLKILILHM